MAKQLMKSWTTEWKPEKYEDTYRDALCDVIKAKRKGQEIHRVAAVEEEEAPDLLSACGKASNEAEAAAGAAEQPDSGTAGVARHHADLTTFLR